MVPLSIITISYNNKNGLLKTIQSVKNQTWKNFEWICIDGASNDGTIEVLQQNSDILNYWISEPDTGVYNAMNKGIRLAKGEYLLFLNSGDCLYENNSLEHVFATPHKEDVLYGDSCFDRLPQKEIVRYSDNRTLFNWYKMSVNHQAAFIKKELFQKEGYDETYKYVADWKRFVEWYAGGKTFLHIPYIISLFDVTGMSMTNFSECEKERDKFFKELFPQYIIETLQELDSYNNKVCRLTKEYSNKRKAYRNIIRLSQNIISIIDKFL